MVRPTYLVLHRTEWERIKRQAGPPPEDPVDLKKEYLNSLAEQSQKWVKTWPDTVYGHIAKAEKYKKEQHKANIAFVKAYTNKMKQGNTEAIKEAKQLIFEDSNYGRLLQSALLESRALEVREAQIKFQKEQQEETAEREKKQKNNDGFLDFHDNDAERQKNEKLKTLECIKYNNETISLKKENELQIKQREKEDAIADENRLKKVLEFEKHQKTDIEQCEKKAREDYEADKKDMKKRKEHEEKLNDALTEIYKKGQDRIKCKTQAVLEKVHQGRAETKWSKDHYRIIDKFHNEQNKSYEDFINKGIKTYEERNAKKGIIDTEKEKAKNSETLLNAQRNKTAGKEQTLEKMCANKCSCDRQSLILKTGTSSKKTNGNDKLVGESGIKVNDEVLERDMAVIDRRPSIQCEFDEVIDKTRKLSFLAPRNKLLEELKKREKEPSPWNDTKGLHSQFAQQADQVLKEIKHKRFARKVVDEYRKLNCLDAATLSVPNY